MNESDWYGDTDSNGRASGLPSTSNDVENQAATRAANLNDGRGAALSNVSYVQRSPIIGPGPLVGQYPQQFFRVNNHPMHSPVNAHFPMNPSLSQQQQSTQHQQQQQQMAFPVAAPSAASWVAPTWNPWPGPYFFPPQQMPMAGGATMTPLTMPMMGMQVPVPVQGALTYAPGFQRNQQHFAPTINSVNSAVQEQLQHQQQQQDRPLQYTDLNGGTWEATLSQSNLFKPEYQRNNKSGGKKHLKCFPFCSMDHGPSQACESSLYLSFSCHNRPRLLTNQDNDIHLAAFARFVCVTQETDASNFRQEMTRQHKSRDDENHPVGYLDNLTETSRDLRVGETITIENVERKMKTTSNQTGILFTGTSFSKSYDEQSRVLTGKFKFHERAWHYGWVAGRYRQDMQHCLRFYIFERIRNERPELYLCRAIVDSPQFKIFSSRFKYNKRKRKDPDSASE